MQPTVLQEARFGCISLLGRSLDECLGGISDNAVTGLYAEHCMAPDSDDEFSTNHPAFHQGQMSEFEPNAQVELHSLQASLKNGKKGRLVSYDTEAGRWMVEMKEGDLLKLKPSNLRLTAGRPTTPRDEFHAVVGEEGVDTDSWTLRPDAAPKCPAGGDVPGRVLRPIAYFLGCAPAKHAKLTRVEVAALRLWTGPMYARYNEAIRDATLRDPGTAALDVEANSYNTTIGLIISGLIKLGRIASAPRDAEGTAVAFRGIAGLELSRPRFSRPTSRGSAGWSSRGSCPCPTTRPWRQSTAGRRTAKWPSFSSWAKPRSAPRSRGCRSFPAIASGSCRRGPTCRLSGARRAGPTE
jgi:hypothetical protein